MNDQQKALADRVTQFCRANPERWVQHRWICGTEACWGGNLAAMTGHTQRSWCGFVVTAPDGTAVSVESVVATQLGIRENQAVQLCDGSNTLDDIDRMVTLLHADPSIPEHVLFRLAHCR